MDLIVSHDQSDFDALASQVAASKLYTDSKIVLSPTVGRELHPYLGLHRDRFPLIDPDAIDWKAIDRVVLVDARSAGRLAHIQPQFDQWREKTWLDVHVFDHHPAREDDVLADFEVVEPIGSTTTLLVERIQAQALTLDAVEATLCALGLHSDTGSLVFSNSTSRDAFALGWLMQQGADCSVINRYLHAPFSERQRTAIARVLRTAQAHVIGGLTVGVARIELDSRLGGLDEVTDRALALLGYQALLGIYVAPNGRIAVIGRANSPHFDIGRLMTRFGGGGHPGAGSAVAQGPAERVEAELLGSLRRTPPRLVQVADIMSSPVQVVAPETPLSVVAERLTERAHSGVCVTNGRSLLGIISRRDVDKARHVGRLHLPASSHMAQNVFTCQVDGSLEEALSTMEHHDVGRLPVLAGQRLVGIVTRSDLLKKLYREPTTA
jgi:tRNA nucleotidyltransferase (CCA-adding enzyme)